MKTRFAGHARRVADFIVSGNGMRPPSYFIVDDDIDISNKEKYSGRFKHVLMRTNLFILSRTGGELRRIQEFPQARGKLVTYLLLV